VALFQHQQNYLTWFSEMWHFSSTNANLTWLFETWHFYSTKPKQKDLFDVNLWTSTNK